MALDNHPPTTLARIDLAICPDQAERLTVYLAQMAPWGWEETGRRDDSARFTIHCPTRDQAQRLVVSLQARVPGLKAEIASVAQHDWAQDWRRFFRPIEIEQTFLVLPSWEETKGSSGLIPIRIEPQMAFGTGQHPSTALCLQALARGKADLPRSAPFLDLGTGSGILGLACAKCGLCGLGLDLDPVAMANARTNRDLNQASGLDLVAGGLDALRADAGFGLILANILALPLLDLAERLVSHLLPEGQLILSGILRSQARSVSERYQGLGLGPPEVLDQDQWAALYWS